MKNIHEIKIEIKGKEWQDILDAVFEEKKKDVKVDGFRKGQITKDMYLKKFGVESLYMDAVDKALPGAYTKMLQDSKLEPVIEPKVDIEHICENDLTFVFEVVTRPEVKLGEYKNLKIKKDKPTVTKEDIEEEITNIRTRMADVVVKEDGKVVKGNTAVIDFEGFVDGKELEGGSGQNFPLEIGSNTFIPGFEDGLIGMKPNEEKELKLKFPEDYVENLKGKDVLFKVRIREIKERVLPEINEELFIDLGYEDVKTEEDFRKKVEEDILNRKEKEADDKYLDQVIDKAISNMEVEINKEIIEDEIKRMLGQYAEQLSYQGITLEQYYEFTKTTEEDLKEKMEPEAILRIKSRYLLEEIVKKENIEVTEKEALEEAEKLAIMYQMTKEELLSMFGGVEMMIYDSKMRKALDLLRK